MFHKNWHSMVLVALALGLTATSAVGQTKNRKQDQKKKEDQRERDELKKDQARLDALQREETTLKREADQLEKDLPLAKTRADGALKKSRELANQLAATRRSAEDAEKAYRANKATIADLVEKIEGSQSPSSDFGKLRAAYLTAREEYKKAIDAAENSEGYKAACQSASQATNRAIAMAEARKLWIDQNSDVISAQTRLAEAKKAHQAALDALLKADPEWVKADQRLDESSRRERDLSSQLQTLAGQATRADRESDAATAAAKALDTKLKRDQQELKKIPDRKEALKKEIERDKKDIRDPRH